VLLIVPDHYHANFRLGTLLSVEKKYYEALYRLWRCIQKNRKDDLALSNYAMVLSILGHHEEAIPYFERALAIDPSNFLTLGNYGNTLEHVGRYTDALKAIDKALAIAPANSNADVMHQNRGVILWRLNRIEDAVKASTAAMEANPVYYQAQYNRGLAKLYLGDLTGGFEDCEAALQDPGIRKPLFGPFPHKQWDGSSFSGKTLLITGEQGLGDTIHFMRYLPYVLAEGGEVILAVHELARRLYAPRKGLRILEHGETSPPFDLQCPLLSLPQRLRMTDPVPPPLPLDWYAISDEQRSFWDARMASNGERRVGLCWSGNGGHKHDADRSIPVEKFATLVKTPGLSFFGFQHEPRPDDVKALETMPEIDSLGREFKTFTDTAAALLQLDLMITVDTSVAHLAASLGIPTWILLPAFGTDWRWQRERTDSAWYPSATLIRQEKRGEWDYTLSKVAKRLKAWNDEAVAA
jgi:hypothetical protein